MKQIFKVSFIYCIVYAVLLVVVLCLLYVYPKLELHLLMNSWHNSVLDTFFKYFSVLAEWPLYILALLPLFWKRWKITAFFAMSEIAIISLNDTKMRRLAEEGDKKAKQIVKLTRNSSRFLSTIQIGVTLAGFLTSASASQS